MAVSQSVDIKKMDVAVRLACTARKVCGLHSIPRLPLLSYSRIRLLKRAGPHSDSRPSTGEDSRDLLNLAILPRRVVPQATNDAPWF